MAPFPKPVCDSFLLSRLHCKTEFCKEHEREEARCRPWINFDFDGLVLGLQQGICKNSVV